MVVIIERIIAHLCVVLFALFFYFYCFFFFFQAEDGIRDRNVTGVQTYALPIYCADVNWRRLAPVRQALVHAAESMQADDLRHADVRIAHRPGETALAWLLGGWLAARLHWSDAARSEEHTSELQSRFDLVCRLLLEKKNIN